MGEAAALVYWGKAGKDGDGYHLLPYHCLDVAALVSSCWNAIRLCAAFGRTARSGGGPSLRLARLFSGPP